MIWAPWASSAPSSISACGTTYAPVLDPANFVTVIDNPYFPLPVGRKLVYTGVKDGQTQIDTVTVTDQKKVILGISTTVVNDVATHDGTLLEKTFDFYAQDKQGNVWYLGESTATLDTHRWAISTDGSWRAGVAGARAGIYMPAHPAPGVIGRQEYFKGHAEDQFRILSLHAHVQTPAVSSSQALLTQETTRLEPGTVDHKLYVRGVGTVLEQAVKGGSERLVLVSVRHT